MAAKRKKKRVNKAKFFRFIVITLLIVALVISFFLFMPIFNINKITVVGNKAVSVQQIKDKSGIKPGMNIFRADIKKAKNQLVSLTMLDRIKIKRKLPGNIEITVIETYPQVIIPYMTGYITLNENGKVMEIMDKIPKDLKIPLISGIEIESAKIGKNLQPKDEVKFSMFMDCIGIMKDKKSIEKFKSMDFSNFSNFVAYTHEGVKVLFGKVDNIEYKVSFLKEILPNVEKVEGAYIDISSPESGIYGNASYEEEEKEIQDEEQESEKLQEETEEQDDVNIQE